MKKLFVLMTAVIILLTVMTGTAFGADAAAIKEAPDIKIVMDGSLTTYKNVPVSVNGSNLLPLREMLVNLGVPNDDDHIIYDSKEKSITIVMEQTTILLKIGDATAYVNDSPLTLNAAPVLYNNSTYIPVRFVAEALDKKVAWDGTTRTVFVSDRANYESIEKLMNKSNEAASQTDKYRVKMDINAVSGTGALKFAIVIKADAAVDKTGKKMYMDMLTNMLGTEIRADSYFADNKAYAINPITGEWEKKTYSDKEYEQLFQTQAETGQIKVEEILCAGLVQKESANPDEIVLRGDVYLADVFKSALAQQKSVTGTNDIESLPGFDKCNLQLVYDKNTSLLRSLDMKVSAEEIKNGQKVTTEITVSRTYRDYNGDFKISVPEEILQGAVEAKPDEGSGGSGKF